jgi:hypothetical protein
MLGPGVVDHAAEHPAEARAAPARREDADAHRRTGAEIAGEDDPRRHEENGDEPEDRTEHDRSLETSILGDPWGDDGKAHGSWTSFF